MTALAVIAILFGFLAVGLPVALATLIAGAIGLLWVGGPATLLGILQTEPLTTASSYEIISVPMFVLMAEFVIISGVADDLFRAANIWVGRLRGGLAMATALAGAGFGAISGSSTASAATLSSTSLPSMLKHGYEPKLAGGVVAISGTLAMLIPPSIALVLFGIIGNVSISQLLIGGVIPGLVVTLAIMLTVAFLVWRDPHAAPAGRAYTMKEKFVSLKVVGPMLVLLFAVTGTIYSGIATPTEASGAGAFVAMLLAVRERKLSLQTFLSALRSCAHTTCMILFIILSAHVFGYFFTLTRITQELVAFVQTLPLPPLAVVAVILAGYLLLGIFMEQIAILILTIPIILPVVVALGYSPVWLGVLIVITAEVGMVMPPLGLNVFVVARYTRRPIGELFRGVMPHIWAHFIVIAVLAAFPSIILWLPSTMSP
ncbi:MAG: TRAP transporter large permease [Rubrivivax sp.]